MNPTNFPAGAFSDTSIQWLMDENIIKNADPANIKPSSLDLSVDLRTIKEVECVFLPHKKKYSIHQTLKGLKTKNVYHSDETIIETGKTYVAEIRESINFSQAPDISARASPKSSTGRTDILAQLISDHVPAYDMIPKNSSGKMYVIFRPKSFPILFPQETISLNQIRFFQKDRNLVVGDDLRALVQRGIIKNKFEDQDLRFSNLIRNQSRIELSLDLCDLGESPGYVAKNNVTKPLIWLPKANEVVDFFEPLKKINGNRTMVFIKDRFYILSTREGVYIPIEYACEMASSEDTLGEYRSHSAGYIDNEWGKNGHRPLTLELRSYENISAYHGQPIAHIILDHMAHPVKKGYDAIDSNYSDQATAKLGKFFK